ncbi:MAG: hypothetical protein M3R20_00800 [Pseudomonadota bacterium]|nr:hypothetical protein [Pseudomonadota bacterium]
MPRIIAPIAASIVATYVLCACSPHNPAPKQPDNTPQPQAASSVVLNSPLGPLLKDRDRAKAVQQTVDAQAAAQNAAIDDQSH